MEKLPLAFAKRYGVMLKGKNNEFAQLVCRQLPCALVLTEVRRACAVPLHLEVVEENFFNALLATEYETDSQSALKLAEDFTEDINLSDLVAAIPETEDLLDMQNEAPIIHLLNALLSQGIREHASDIHIETYKNNLVIRFRIDGVLREILRPQRIIAPLLISRVKVMARLDIAEKRLPQDGRISIQVAGRVVDLRVSVIPTSHGERVVMRILDKQAANLDLHTLGMSSEIEAQVADLIANPHGIILVTGPTGSGKTTTLYAALSRLDHARLNIMTVEDPIEYEIQGISQTQVNVKADMTFAKGLRAMLRQDPDVVLVGEIRDSETARIAVQASLTGHLVFSTLHTNSAVGAISRMMDIGVEPFLLSSSLLAVIAQRLVRLLCPHCKSGKPATQKACHLLQIKPDTAPIIYHPVGCNKCHGSGYIGRSGLYELIIIDDELRAMIHDNGHELDLKQQARIRAPSLRRDGMRRVLLGETSIEEVLRVTSEEI